MDRTTGIVVLLLGLLVEVSGEVEYHLIDMIRTLIRPELKVIDDKAATMRVAR